MGEGGGGRLSKLLSFGTAGGLAGVAAFALFDTTYTRAYAELGVEPEEVGINTTNIIGRSVGVVLLPLPLLPIVVVGGIIALIGVVGLFVTLRFWSQFGLWYKLCALLTIAFTWALIQGFVETGSVGAAAHLGVYSRMWDLPDAYVAGIRQGKPTESTKANGLTLFYMRADPARVDPAGGNVTSPGVASLTNKTVLFLGASNGTSVFYDSSKHAAVKVPSASIVVSVLDSTDRINPACQIKPVPKIFGLSIYNFEGKLSC